MIHLHWKRILTVFALAGLWGGPALAVEYRELWLGDAVPIFANDHHAGMRLHLAIDGGKVTRAAVLVPMGSPVPRKIEGDRFTIDNGRLKGGFTYRLERYKQEDEDMAITVDAGLAEDGDHGTWTAAADGRERKGPLRVAPTLTAADLSDKRKLRGHIDGVTVRNFVVHNRSDKERIRLSGYSDEFMIRNVTFEGLVIEGKPISKLEDIPRLEEQFTENITFRPAP